MTQIHRLARTTPKIRAEIRIAQGSLREIAERYNVTPATVRKWRQRKDLDDRSHRPNRLCTTLSPVQEAIVVELRRTLLLPLDDLLVVTREFIHPGVSRSSLDRCLRRHEVSRLSDLYVQDKPAAPKTFKDYEPGFVHVDIKYLPQMPDEADRRYLFVAIDRATRWVFMHIYDDQTEVSTTDFLNRLYNSAPMTIVKVLTDNGSQFTDRFTSKKNSPTGNHAFDQICVEYGIEHRLIPPRHPQTNEMVERFNKRISEVVGQTRFGSALELHKTLHQYVHVYNNHIPQRALNHRSPSQAVSDWQKTHPHLFKNSVYNHPGLDI